jgi:hypothetical protein
MRGTSYASWRVRRLVAALAAAGGACGPSEPTPVIYPSTTEAARRTLELEFVRSLAVSPEPSLRPDERGAVASDPARGLIYAGGRDGSLLALESDRGEVVWEHKFSGAIGSEPLLLAGEGVLLVGTGNGVLTALDLERRAPRWAYETQGTIMNRPLVAEGGRLLRELSRSGLRPRCAHGRVALAVRAALREGLHGAGGGRGSRTSMTSTRRSPRAA